MSYGRNDLAIRSECGRLLVDFRNSSNGYYGGYLHTLSPDVTPTKQPWKEVG